MNKLKPIFLIKIVLAILIAYQSYKVYTLEKQLDYLEKTGQLKCSKP
jgi:hypothetical protein